MSDVQQQFFTPVHLGPNRHKTPEGYLVCYGARIARTGMQIYDQSEIDVVPGSDGKVRVYREASEVFCPETIASFEGKTIVVTHPFENVIPETWKDLAVGHIQNVRRGTGVEDDLLLADLFINHPEAIKMVEANPNQELSCGYGARYEIRAVGHAYQRFIIGNHVAFVDRGRCGPICSTKDHLPLNLWAVDDEKINGLQEVLHSVTLSTEVHQLVRDAMGKPAWLDGLVNAFKTKDEKAFEAAVRDAVETESVLKKTGTPDENETHTHIHLHTGAPEITKAEGGLPNTGETAVTSAKDSKVGGDSSATFGGKAFFADAALDKAFKDEMKGMKDSIEALGKSSKDGFEEFKKEMKDAWEGLKGAAGHESEHAGGAGEEKNKAIEGELKEEAPPGTSDAHKARDSAFLEDSFAKTISLAAILVPNISVPTFDKALDPATTYGAICSLRRKALTAYQATADGAAVISDIIRTADVASMPCRDLAPLFRSAAAVQKAKNAADTATKNSQDDAMFERSKHARTQDNAIDPNAQMNGNIMQQMIALANRANGVQDEQYDANGVRKQ